MGDHLAVPAVAVTQKVYILHSVAAHVQEPGFLRSVQNRFGFLLGDSPSAQTFDDVLGDVSEPHAHFERHPVEFFPAQLGGLTAIAGPHSDGIVLFDIGHDLIIGVNDIAGLDGSGNGNDPRDRIPYLLDGA